MISIGLQSRVLLVLCFVSSAACNTFAFTEEPPERAGKGDGYCSRILRAQGNRKEVNNEFRLRVEGDPESYQPGSTYRGWCLSARFTHTALVGTMSSLSNKHRTVGWELKEVSTGCTLTWHVLKITCLVRASTCFLPICKCASVLHLKPQYGNIFSLERRKYFFFYNCVL